MTVNGPHHPYLPDEADLLAWVEGEPLSPETRSLVQRALQSDPTLARRMEQMRADRMALQTLSEERAPGGLIEAVESALQPVLERELLLGLRDGEPAESSPVVSMVRPEKRGIFQTFLADRAGRRMALAATLLLMVGGATWWAATTLTGGTKPPPIGPVALNEPEKRTDKIATRGEGKVETSKPDEGMRIATATQAITPPAAAKTADATTETTPAPSTDTPTVAAVADAVGPVRPEMDGALAAELARERKLVIRVVSADSPRRVCDRVRKECSATAWKLAGPVPTELAAALDAKPFDLAKPSPRIVEHEPPQFAGNETFQPLIGPPAPTEIPVPEESEPQPVYLVQARLDPATMSQLKASLEKSGHGDEVLFEERYEPLPLTPGGTPVLTPQAMLWWTNPPAGWTSWGEVPVVIEPR